MRKIWWVTLSSLLLMAGVSCAGNTGGPLPVQVQLQTDKPVYRNGEMITVALTALNPNPEPVQLLLSSSQIFDFWLSDGEQIVWKWSSGRFFAQALSRLILEPGLPATYAVKFNQQLPSGALLQPGRYQLNGLLKTKDPIMAAPVMIQIVP